MYLSESSTQCSLQHSGLKAINFFNQSEYLVAPRGGREARVKTPWEVSMMGVQTAGEKRGQVQWIVLSRLVTWKTFILWAEMLAAACGKGIHENKVP